MNVMWRRTHRGPPPSTTTFMKVTRGECVSFNCTSFASFHKFPNNPTLLCTWQCHIDHFSGRLFLANKHCKTSDFFVTSLGRIFGICRKLCARNNHQSWEGSFLEGLILEGAFAGGVNQMFIKFTMCIV